MTGKEGGKREQRLERDGENQERKEYREKEELKEGRMN